MLNQMTRVIGRKTEALLIARGLLVGQLGRNLRERRRSTRQSNRTGKVGLGEQTVIIGGFLHAHHDGTLRRRIQWRVSW